MADRITTLLLVFLAAALFFLLLVVRRQRKQLARLNEEALRDPLTGLLNRRALHHVWPGAAITAPKIPAAPAPVLVLVDLVGFKSVNDRHGHIVGDALLRAAAARLFGALVAGATIVRWGGDEFAAIIPGTSHDEQLAAFRQAMAAPFDLGPCGGAADTRLGIRWGSSAGEENLADAERAAALALLHAKKTGAPSGQR